MAHKSGTRPTPAVLPPRRPAVPDQSPAPTPADTERFLGVKPHEPVIDARVNPAKRGW